jgi:hypothetical protein
VLFEWHSLEHVGLDETYARVSQDGSPGIDYFHVNFIEVDHDSNLIVSARETFAVYKIDRKTGEVMWRLGGKKSDFEMGPGTRFAYQHDARRQRDGTISIFDRYTTSWITLCAERPPGSHLSGTVAVQYGAEGKLG